MTMQDGRFKKNVNSLGKVSKIQPQRSAYQHDQEAVSIEDQNYLYILTDPIKCTPKGSQQNLN